MPSKKNSSPATSLSFDQTGLKNAIHVVSAMSMKDRQKILKLLVSRGPMLVMELRKPTKLSSVIISQHLRWLKEAGLVVSSREGLSHRYSVPPTGYARMQLFLK